MLREGDIAKIRARKSRVAEPSIHQRQRRLNAEQKQELVNDYKAGEGSIYKLAKIWGISAHTVSKHLRAAGLSIGFKPLSYPEIAKARDLRKEGLSFNAIGRALKRDPKTIKSALD